MIHILTNMYFPIFLWMKDSSHKFLYISSRKDNKWSPSASISPLLSWSKARKASLKFSTSFAGKKSSCWLIYLWMFSIYIFQHSLPKMISLFWHFEVLNYPHWNKIVSFIPEILLVSFNTLFLWAIFINRSFEKADVKENKRFVYETHRISSIWLFIVKELNKETKGDKGIIQLPL